MSIKVRVSVIILVTFLFGILTGAMFNRALVQRRIGRALSRMRPNQITAVLEQRLKPDKKQSRQIREILTKHTAALLRIREGFLEEMNSEMESLKAELDPILTPRQKKLLRERPFVPRGFSKQAWQLMSSPDIQRRIAGTLVWLEKKLSLSEEQKLQIREILSKPGLRGAPPIERYWNPEKRAVERSHRTKEQNQAIENILTPEQKAKFLEIQVDWEKRKKELQSIRIREKLPFPLD